MVLLDGWTIGVYNNYLWMDPTNTDVVNFMSNLFFFFFVFSFLFFLVNQKTNQQTTTTNRRNFN